MLVVVVTVVWYNGGVWVILCTSYDRQFQLLCFLSLEVEVHGMFVVVYLIYNLLLHLSLIQI